MSVLGLWHMKDTWVAGIYKAKIISTDDNLMLLVFSGP